MMIKDLHKVGELEYFLLYDAAIFDQSGYGPHLMLDIQFCEDGKLSDLNFCRQFLSTLPAQIGMTKIYGPVIIDYKNPEDQTKDGITGFTIIAESHISIHTYPEKNYAFIDIFSCKNFDFKSVTEKVIQLFQPRFTNAYVCMRGVDFN